jgi:hypothetical protein
MGEVINLNNATSLDIPADRVLKAAIEKLDKVVLMGYDKDGNEYFASSVADGGTVLWLMERLKITLMGIDTS